MDMDNEEVVRGTVDKLQELFEQAHLDLGAFQDALADWATGTQDMSATLRHVCRVVWERPYLMLLPPDVPHGLAAVVREAVRGHHCTTTDDDDEETMNVVNHPSPTTRPITLCSYRKQLRARPSSAK
jgi:hypothetical protein